MNDQDRERFMSFVHEEPNTGCWLWAGSIDRNGYGQFWLNRTNNRAHRIALLLHGIELAHDLYATHRCDVRHCVNPEHIQQGTAAENSADMVRRGRAAHGLALPHAKLTPSLATEYRARYAHGGVTMQALADEARVCINAISKLIRGETYTRSIGADHGKE